MRIDRELMRGAGPVAVLQLLEQREMYGYELVEALSRQSDGVLTMGQSTLYPLLYNRKYYTVTKKGMTHLAAHRRQWQDLMGAMKGLGLLET